MIHTITMSVADLGGGGLGGLNPPPPLGLPSKNLMCIEKRHHNMSRPTQYVPIALCLRLSLRQLVDSMIHTITITKSKALW